MNCECGEPARIGKKCRRCYQRHYHRRPDVKKKDKEYRQRPEVMKRRKIWYAGYIERPGIRERVRRLDRERHRRYHARITNQKIDFFVDVFARLPDYAKKIIGWDNND